MDFNLLNLNIKDEMNIKEEFLDFTQDYFKSENSEDPLTVNASNDSEPVTETEEGKLVKEEPMEHVRDEGLSFNQYANVFIKDDPMELDPLKGAGFNQSEEPKHFETFDLKQNIMNSKRISRKGQILHYDKDIGSGEEKESARMIGNSSNTIQEISKDEQRRFQCDLCSYGTNKKGHFKTHLVSHSDLRPFKCSQCDSAFKVKSKLNSHLVVHSDLRPFKCSQCDSAFKVRSKLNSHLIVHSDLKPFKCSDCESTFKTRGTMKAHLLYYHNDVRSYKCSFCDSSFKKESNLKKHLVVHSDERPFKCSHCESAFKTKSTLKSHVHIHSDFRPFKCSHCNISFKRKQDLKKHLPVHSELKPFKCPYCETTFKFKNNIKKHVLKHSEQRMIYSSSGARLKSFSNHLFTAALVDQQVPLTSSLPLAPSMNTDEELYLNNTLEK